MLIVLAIVLCVVIMITVPICAKYLKMKELREQRDNGFTDLNQLPDEQGGIIKN